MVFGMYSLTLMYGSKGDNVQWMFASHHFEEEQEEADGASLRNMTIMQNFWD
jgi:hypothetical protein